MQHIIVVDNPLFKSLYSRLANNASPDWTLDVLSESDAILAIQRNNFALALVTPLVLANIQLEDEPRIFRTNVLVTEDYSGDYTIHIKSNQRTISSVYFDNIPDFIRIAVGLLLSERFGVLPLLSEDIDSADILVNASNSQIDGYFQMDLSEDWFDTFEVPLVLAFWIGMNERIQPNSAAVIESFADVSLLDVESVHTHPLSEQDYEHIGQRYYHWREHFAPALEKTFDLLYYHNHAKHIADVITVD